MQLLVTANSEDLDNSPISGLKNDSHPGFQFDFLGQISPISNYYHVMVRIDVKSLLANVNIICRLIEAVKTHFTAEFLKSFTPSYDMLKYRDTYSPYFDSMQDECEQLLSRTQSLWSLATTRRKGTATTDKNYLTTFQSKLDSFLKEQFDTTNDKFRGLYTNNKTGNANDTIVSYSDLMSCITGPSAPTYADLLHNDSITFSPPVPQIPNSTSSRGKRQAFEVISAILGLGSSIYTLSQVESLATALHDTNSNLNVLFDQVDLNADRLANLSSKVDSLFVSLNSTLVDIDQTKAKIHFNTIYSLMSSTLTAYTFTCLSYEIGLSALQESRLSPSLVGNLELYSVFDRARNKALASNLEFFSSDANALIASPSSTILKNGEPYVVIHIALKSKVQTLQTYLFSSQPVIYHNVILQIKPQKRVLIVNPERNLYALMTREDLDSCTRFEDLYHCQRPLILRRDVKKSCLPRLILGILSDLHLYCDVELSKEEERIDYVGDSTYRVLSAKEPVTIDITCNNGVTSHPVISGVKEITVNASCLAVSKYNLFYGSQNFITEIKTTTAVPVTAKRFREMLQIPDLTTKRLLETLNHDYFKDPTNSIKLRDFQEKYKSINNPVEHTIVSHRSEIIIASVILVVILGIASFCIYKCCLARFRAFRVDMRNRRMQRRRLQDDREAERQANQQQLLAAHFENRFRQLQQFQQPLRRQAAIAQQPQPPERPPPPAAQGLLPQDPDIVVEDLD